jgi:hypothetical protein
MAIGVAGVQLIQHRAKIANCHAEVGPDVLRKSIVLYQRKL